jgi:hypothetical protein
MEDFVLAQTPVLRVKLVEKSPMQGSLVVYVARCGKWKRLVSVWLTPELFCVLKNGTPLPK